MEGSASDVLNGEMMIPAQLHLAVYIQEKLRVPHHELHRLRDQDFRFWISQKKLSLVLDLDPTHTLLNSTPINELTENERFLKGPGENLPDVIKSSIYRLDSMQLMTKLRPFVHTFLKEASKMFDMYLYTMGSRDYALALAKLLDPRDEYFRRKVIANEDSTRRDRKGLDM
ncbi:OLC1v1009893C1 [Oldenlandia corymbosa var. corymbosa]|uniref:protein-serine/threonine phosphatase n=1 Tax=Oldenlandia corymbosa var. corymbosa TaxID=529605 RepID=A0AAV1DPZ8_OLDCO|nr:OLC1v1009893C1 [Oldenlandia corymbosa var. corymbosa]